MGAEYLSYVKFIATDAPTFFWVYYFSLSQCVQYIYAGLGWKEYRNT